MNERLLTATVTKTRLVKAYSASSKVVGVGAYEYIYDVLNDLKYDDIVLYHEHYQSNKCGTFIVIDKYRGGPKNEPRITVKFDYSGYEKTNIAMKEFRKGTVKDPYYPQMYDGHGCMGVVEGNVHKLYPIEYDSWRSILRRCYEKSNKLYHNYGAKGITMCERWQCFEYFLEDVKKMENYEEWHSGNREYQLDKDIIPYKLGLTGAKCYSPEYCCITHRSNNMAQQSLDHSRERSSVYVGVSAKYDVNRTVYKAFVRKNNVQYNCGTYDNEVAAANARNRGAIKMYGSKVEVLNDVPYMSYQEILSHSTSKMTGLAANIRYDLCKIVKKPLCKIINKEGDM